MAGSARCTAVSEPGARVPLPEADRSERARGAGLLQDKAAEMGAADDA